MYNVRITKGDRSSRPQIRAFYAVAKIDDKFKIIKGFDSKFECFIFCRDNNYLLYDFNEIQNINIV